jgi:GNAT superfamily N-acetyltransferase
MAHLEWRGSFTDDEVNQLHAEAFGTRVFSSDEWPWNVLVDRHSLGWVTARSDRAADAELVGFLNVPWDGFTHAWLQDVMVRLDARHGGVGVAMVAVAVEHARAARCEWMHVDFEDDLRAFYLDACGFSPTNAGLMRLA